MSKTPDSNNSSRRRFLKLSATGAIVAVIAGVGAYLALQPQPTAPAVTPRTAPPPAATPSPATPPKPMPSLMDKANEEGAVMTYTTWDIDSLEIVKRGFEKKYPKIKMDISRGVAYTLVERLKKEHVAGKRILDIFTTSVSTLLIEGVKDLVDKYISPEAAVWPPHLKDPEGYWIVPQLAPQAIQYNTQLVKGEDIPKSYWDLLKPRFKNRLAVYGARTSNHAPLISKRKIIGPDRWMEFLRGLKAQNIKETSVVGQFNVMLAQGEAEIGLWAYTGSATEQILKGAPVDYVRSPGTLLAGGSVLWLYKNAPHPNAGRLLYDYLLSEEGQTLINDMGKYILLRPGIPPKMGLGIGTGEPVKTEYVAVAWPWTEKDALDIVAEWKSVFPVE